MAALDRRAFCRSGRAVNDFQPIGSFARAIVLRAIENCADPVERKRRIMLAREHAFLSDQEAADWLAILEVRAA